MSETELERLRAEQERIRRAVVDTYGEDYAGEDTAAEVERLLGHLAEFETDMRRILGAKSEALERAQAERDALKAAIERTRRMAQVWVDIRPTYPTASDAGHGIAFAGRQVLDALAIPRAPGGES